VVALNYIAISTTLTDTTGMGRKITRSIHPLSLVSRIPVITITLLFPTAVVPIVTPGFPAFMSPPLALLAAWTTVVTTPIDRLNGRLFGG
jgi:hypothetical protein